MEEVGVEQELPDGEGSSVKEDVGMIAFVLKRESHGSFLGGTWLKGRDFCRATYERNSSELHSAVEYLFVKKKKEKKVPHANKKSKK